MPSHVFLTGRILETVLLALQTFQVVFLWIHDWIPLGRLNDVAAVRGQDTFRRLVIVTLVQSVPWTIGLYFSMWYFGRVYPDWLSIGRARHIRMAARHFQDSPCWGAIPRPNRRGSVFDLRYLRALERQVSE